MPERQFPVAVWKAMADAGYTQAQAAHLLGVCRGQAVRVKKTHNVDFVIGEQTMQKYEITLAGIRDPEEREAYLLDCLTVLAEEKGVYLDENFPREWKLTPSERKLLSALMKAAPRTMTKEGLMNAIYFDEIVDHVPEMKIVDVLVCKIRKKLKAADVKHIAIKTVWGQGYYCVDPSEQPQDAQQAVE